MAPVGVGCSVDVRTKGRLVLQSPSLEVVLEDALGCAWGYVVRSPLEVLLRWMLLLPIDRAAAMVFHHGGDRSVFGVSLSL
jgi:hypothetical protein